MPAAKKGIVSGYEIDGTTLALGANNIIGINLANANTWTALQTFGNNISFGGATLDVASLATGQYIYYNGTNWVNTNAVDGTTLNNTSGTLSINLGNANTWTALQTFGNNISFGGATLNVATLTTGQYVYYNGTNWVNTNAVDGTTLKNSSGTLSINLGNANTWTATQTFTTIVPSLVNISSATTSVTGTTAGSIIWDMPFQGSGYKKVVVYLDGYENDTTTAQTITFPTAFSYAPNVYNPGAVPGITVSTTALSIDPDTTTVYTAWIIVEGF